ncbi:hypothetical protein ACFLZ7_01415 [Nanoarchaeota archaeon]
MADEYEEFEGYSDKKSEDQLEDDEVSAGEEGFMRGYEEADEIEKSAEEEDEE